MKLYSWNVLWDREVDPDFERAFSFIKGLDFDVLCLQEVTEDLLARLKTLPLHIASGIEHDWIEAPDKMVRLYSIILSPHNIRSSHDFAFPQLFWPRRTNLFIRVMYRWGWRRIQNRRSLYGDVELPELGLTRVFCLHLTLSYPKRLLLEFETAAALRNPSLPAIFCGDFNIIESFRATVLNWILGGSVWDIFGWRSSRSSAEKRFAELGLQNPLRGKRTQTLSYSQLDHILVPKGFRIVKAEVLQDRIGSDHHPIFVECVPEKSKT